MERQGSRGFMPAWAPIVAAAVLALAIRQAPAQTLSPGPLSQVHASLDEAGRCIACHDSGSDVAEAKCLECHPTARAGKGLHGDLVRSAGGACGRCHPEHHGRAFRLVRMDAQVPGFTHDRTGFPLDGRHAALECAKCHRGKLHYQGLSARCASCHPDRHGGQFRDDCGTCHASDGFRGAGRFQHGRAWALEGRHAAVPCAKCHPDRDGTDRKWNGLRHGACVDCHADPHQGTMKRPCAGCHVVEGWKTLPEGVGRDHAPGRFPLEGRHRTTACERCHGAKMERKVEARCASCHPEPHEGRFGARCETCHDARGWHPRPGAAFDHDRAGYRLEGGHRRVACERCHGGPGNYAKRYRDLRHEACRDCHADPHGGPLASVEGGDRCEACHTVEGFVPAAYDAARHARAAFPLTGAHRAVPCAGCHRPKPGDKVALRLPGRACADCHADPHQGAFAARMAGKGCAACHSTASWRAADFDHASTRFPLQGRHRDAPCRACHGNDQGGASPRYAGVDARCRSCHADRHAGQFDGEPRVRECGDCHDTATFRVASFDHGARTAFPLEGRHATAACAACHPAVRLPGGGEAALYRPTSAACGTCHADPHRGAAGATCSDCHRSAESWWKVEASSAFDHGRTGFPLRARHADAPCAGCHDGRLRLAGGGGKACVNCHRDDPHRGREGDACEECHTPRGWRVSDDVRSHDRTRFPLTGAHRVADCVACHPGQEPPEYRGTPRECAACHVAESQRPGNHPDHVAAGFPLRCDECHNTYDWNQARIRHLGWPLRGAHAAADCFRCHAGGRYAGTPRDCIACHQADYDGAPDHATGGYSTACSGCHAESAWAVLKAGWHDGVFPLRGGHRRAACADCHPGGRPATFTCTTCHEHARDRMDAEHRERGGYVYQDQACLACHPRGDD